MRRALLAALLATLAAPGLAHAQEVQRVVTASADARDVVELGEQAFVATEGGLLVLRDGAIERTLGPADGLPGARLRSVSAVDGELWVGAVEGTARLAIEDGVPRVVATYPTRRVRRVVRFAGAHWLASYGGGLMRLRDDTVVPVELGRPHAYRRLSDLIVRGDELWVATQGVGVLRLDADGHIVGRIRRREGLATEYTWRFAPVGDELAVTTIAGVTLFDANGLVVRRHPLSRAARRLPVRDVRALTATGDAVYFGTYGRGLFRAPRNGARGVGRPRRVGRQDIVQALATTDAGVLVGHPRGLARVDGRRLRPIVEGGLPSGDVTALAHAFGTLWVGTFGHGLARMRDGAFESFSTERWALDPRINDLAVTGRGRSQRLWIATDRGLWYHDGRVTSRVEDPHGPSWIHTTSLHVDRAGDLWVTTGRELCRRRSARWSCWTGDSTFPVAQLHAVTRDSRGRVWVGGLHGLYEFDETTERFSRHTVSSGDLPVDWVTALVPWGRGVMAGTYHGGLAIGDASRFRTVGESDGLPSGWVNPHAIRRVGGEVWIGTLERGLIVGRPDAWRHLTTADGLPSDDVTDVLADRDGAWVATRGGLARVSR